MHGLIPSQREVWRRKHVVRYFIEERIYEVNFVLLRLTKTGIAICDIVERAVAEAIKPRNVLLAALVIAIVALLAW